MKRLVMTAVFLAIAAGGYGAWWWWQQSGTSASAAESKSGKGALGAALKPPWE